jgi:hypothetical protein
MNEARVGHDPQCGSPRRRTPRDGLGPRECHDSRGRARIARPGVGRRSESPYLGLAGLPDTHLLAKGWPEHYVWNPFAVKTLLERAGLRMGAPSSGPCLSGSWVFGSPVSRPLSIAIAEPDSLLVKVEVAVRFDSGNAVASLMLSGCSATSRTSRSTRH